MSQAGALNASGGPSGNVQTLTGNSGGAVPPTSNNINTLGTGSITIAGNPGTSTLTTQLTGLTSHNVLVGAGTATVTKVAPSATSGVPLVSQGSFADPVFGTAVVAGGGTGDTSFTAYSVICGGTTSTGALQNVSGVGTSGQVLTSNGAAALPTWQAGSSGSSTYFEAYLSTETGNIGYGSFTTVVFDATVVNIGSAYNTGTGVFTAPATGFYGFSSTVWVGNATGASGSVILQRTGSAESSRAVQENFSVIDAGTIVMCIGWQQQMTSGDTVKIQTLLAGTGNYNVFGNPPSGGNSQMSVFCGWRIA